MMTGEHLSSTLIISLIWNGLIYVKHWDLCLDLNKISVIKEGDVQKFKSLLGIDLSKFLLSQ